MKTTAKLIAATVLLGASAAMLSFTAKKTETKEILSLGGTEEYYQVRKYIFENICRPLQKADENKGIKVNQFSRCPSGYNLMLTTKQDDVKLNADVFGEIKVYNGCSGRYYCDFKVNAAGGAVLVKNKEMTDYVSVDEWLRMQAAPEVKKETAKEIKG